MTINYRMSNEDYHAHSSIGSTSAKLALTSWRLFNMARAGKCEQRVTAALSEGTDFHALVLEPARARGLISEGPINPKTGATYGRATQAWATWRKDNPYAIVPDEWMLKSIHEMPEEVRNEIEQAEAHPEASVFQTVLGVNIKARPDLWVPKKGIIYDLKKISASDNLERAIERQIISYKYWLSEAWYKTALLTETGTPHEFRFIFAEDGPPYRWRIVELDFEYQQYGQMAVDGILRTIASGDYPQEDIYHTATLPNYMAYEGEE